MRTVHSAISNVHIPSVAPPRAVRFEKQDMKCEFPSPGSVIVLSIGSIGEPKLAAKQIVFTEAMPRCESQLHSARHRQNLVEKFPLAEITQPVSPAAQGNVSGDVPREHGLWCCPRLGSPYEIQCSW